MTDTTTPTAGASERAAIVQAIGDRVIVALFLITGAVLGAVGDESHASMCIAGALGALAPLGLRPGALTVAARALPLALAIGAGVMLSGCGGTVTAAGVGRVTCAVIERAHATCSALGLAPDEPCPAFAAD